MLRGLWLYTCLWTSKEDNPVKEELEEDVVCIEYPLKKGTEINCPKCGQTEVIEEEPYQLHIRKFDISKIRSYANISIHGKRETGKSSLIKHLLNKLELDNGLIVAPTNSITKDFISTDQLRVESNFSTEILKTFKDEQLKLQQTEKNVKDKVLVLDDCWMDSKLYSNDKNLRWFILNGRQVKLNTFITQTYPLGVPLPLRANMDYIFLFKENNKSALRKLYEQYAGMFPTFDIFREVLNKCTENYGCLVIDSRKSSEKLTEQVFWYRGQL